MFLVVVASRHPKNRETRRPEIRLRLQATELKGKERSTAFDFQSVKWVAALKFTNKSIFDRLGLLLDVLRLCVTLFEYGGKMQKSSQFPAVPRPKSARQDMKAKLEEVLLVNKGAAREMMQRHSRVMLGNDGPFWSRVRDWVGVVSNCTMGLFSETIPRSFVLAKRLETEMASPKTFP